MIVSFVLKEHLPRESQNRYTMLIKLLSSHWCLHVPIRIFPEEIIRQDLTGAKPEQIQQVVFKGEGVGDFFCWISA